MSLATIICDRGRGGYRTPLDMGVLAALHHDLGRMTSHCIVAAARFAA